jgi:hypothetical protein
MWVPKGVHLSNRMNNPGPPPGKSYSSGQDILLPLGPSKRKQHTMLLEINSRDRNLSAYPNPSNFRVRLQRPLKDVCSIQLVGGTLPTRFFNVDTGWNQFTFREGTTDYTVTLSPGRYTATYLGVEIASKLNTLTRASPAHGNTYSVQISPITDQMTITRDHGSQSFAFLFASGIHVDVLDRNNALIELNSPRKLMGFLLQDYSDSNGIITGPQAVDLDFLLNRLYLFINHETTQDFGMIERSSGRLNPHAILYMDDPMKLYKTFTKDLFQPVYSATPTPIARISALDVALRDEFDRLINLNGRDFTLLLEITYLN